MEEYILTIQERITALLHTLDANLQTASKDNCSEIARIVGCWILRDKPGVEVYILKGTFSDQSAHDIVAIENSKIMYLIDPTVWQFFPEADTMYIDSTPNLSEAAKRLSGRYGGSWTISEKQERCAGEYEKELLQKL